jgi:membrane fusion protein (multidrug efflux system)
VAEIEAADTENDREVPTSRLRGPLLLAAPVVLVLGAAYIYFTGGRYESTDNAEIQTGLVGIAADASGKVVEIDVTENQLVKAGQVLFRIDPATPRAAADAAEADLSAARAGGSASRADYQQSLSEQQGAEARLTYATGEAQRQKQLVEQGISSKSQYDQAATAVQTARDAVAAAQAMAESHKAQLAGSLTGSVDDLPTVRRAAAALETARIALANTVVRAPRDGVVTKVNQLQLGSYVSASRPVFMLAGTRFWVEANFKENQLQHMRVGQPATISIDAYPDVKLTGHVASFSPGTGNSFSVLPAENATGNWVKVVQRLPVEIDVDAMPTGLPLHTGLSAEVEVDTGHKRHLFGGSDDDAQSQPAPTPETSGSR